VRDTDENGQAPLILMIGSILRAHMTLTFSFLLSCHSLDLETTEALIEAIKTFQGGVLLVSHDQHLLTNVCKHLYVVEKGNVELLQAGVNNTDAFNAYKKAVVQGRR
jgi:ABC-type uncharacterized transport system ATPase subunit